MKSILKAGIIALLVIAMVVMVPVAATPILNKIGSNNIQVGVNVNTAGSQVGYTTVDGAYGGQYVAGNQGGKDDTQLIGNGNAGYAIQQSVTGNQNAGSTNGKNDIQVGANANLGSVGTQIVSVTQTGSNNVQIGGNVNLGYASAQSVSLTQQG